MFLIWEIENLFVQNVSDIFLEIWCLENKNKKLKETRDLLLPKLVSGEIEVDNLTIKQ